MLLSAGGQQGRVAIVVSDDLHEALATPFAERGIDAVSVTDVLARGGLVAFDQGTICIALISVSNDPVETIASLFSLRNILGNHLPGVAMLSAMAPPVESVLLKAGCVHCLRHPVSYDELTTVIRAAAASANMSTPAQQKAALLREARFVFRTPEEARDLAQFLARLCPNPMRQQLGIEELLLNAVEHGNLGITNAEKARLLSVGADWQAELSRRLQLAENAEKRVQVFWRHQSSEISLSVVDEGEGFDHEKWMQPQLDAGLAPNGRGIALARALSFDSLQYEGRGNHVIAKVAHVAPATDANDNAYRTRHSATESGEATLGLAGQLDELLRANLAAKRDQDMALRVLTNILSNSQLEHPAVRCMQAPLERFSGDVLLVHPLDNGGLRIFLGDFAGHGLSAAIGTIPLASIFFATVRKGVPLVESISTINQKLHEIMPPSMFCAATILEVNATWTEAQLLTAGMPAVLQNHYHSGLTSSWSTQHLPLGVLPSDQLSFPLLQFSIGRGDRLYVFSDGVTEQRNQSDELFGQQRLIDTISSLGPGSDVVQKLREDIALFKAEQAASDDLSFLELTIIPPKASIPTAAESGTWTAFSPKE
jgi:phosphoserine phosphatase RsbU/P